MIKIPILTKKFWVCLILFTTCILISNIHFNEFVSQSLDEFAPVFLMLSGVFIITDFQQRDKIVKLLVSNKVNVIRYMACLEESAPDEAYIITKLYKNQLEDIILSNETYCRALNHMAINQELQTGQFQQFDCTKETKIAQTSKLISKRLDQILSKHSTWQAIYDEIIQESIVRNCALYNSNKMSDSELIHKIKKETDIMQKLPLIN